MPDEKNDNGEAPESKGEEHAPMKIEEYPLSELAVILSKAEHPYYCVDTLCAERSRRKLIDRRSVLTDSIVENLIEWGLGRNQIIRVTQNPGFGEDEVDEAAKDIAHFVNRIHHYLVNIFSENLPSYKVEIQGIGRTAVEMLDGVFSDVNIDNVTVGPSDLRSFTSYYDHLANTSIYWLALFAAYNKFNKVQAGSVEVWRSKNKAEMAKITAGNTYKAEFATYYDFYDRETCPSDIEEFKKGDLSLVLSGFYASLFHDIAFLKEPKMILSRLGDKDIDEKLKIHTDESNNILKDKLSILADERPLTRSVIKYHHEYVDGSGYPTGRSGKKLHLFAQMLSIADMYDEYSTRFNRSTIIRYMARGAGRIFDGNLLRAFLGILRPFDLGERVDVYEGKNKESVMRAEVLDSKNRFRPRIKIIEAMDPTHDGDVGREIDLSNDENVIYNI